MYIDENDNRTPRERVDDTILRRMLTAEKEERRDSRGALRNEGRGNLPCNPDAVASDHYRLMNFPLGMVYSPIQQWRDAYEPDVALRRGTLFRELDMPWEVPGPSGSKGGCGCDR